MAFWCLITRGTNGCLLLFTSGGFKRVRAWWLCTLITLPLFTACCGFRTRQFTPFLVIPQLLPCVLKSQLLFVVVVEDLMRMFENIVLIMAATFLSSCCFIRPTKFAYLVIYLLPPLLTMRWLSHFRTCNIGTCCKVQQSFSRTHQLFAR